MTPPSMEQLLVPELKLRSGGAKQLERRLGFLWQAAHALLPTSAALAHSLTASAVHLARDARADLSRPALDFVCERCAALLVPSVSADVRVQSVGSQAPVNRRLARARRRDAAPGAPQRLVNVVRVTCRRCSHANVRCGASEVAKPKSKKRPAETTAEATGPDAKRAKTGPATAAPVAASLPMQNNDAGTKEQQVVTREVASEAPSKLSVAAATTSVQVTASQPTSVFAAPASPPRKLLDGPKKKKKKKAPDAAVTAVKSSLSSFLQSMRPGASTK